MDRFRNWPMSKAAGAFCRVRKRRSGRRSGASPVCAAPIESKAQASGTLGTYADFDSIRSACIDVRQSDTHDQRFNAATTLQSHRVCSRPCAQRQGGTLKVRVPDLATFRSARTVSSRAASTPHTRSPDDTSSAPRVIVAGPPGLRSRKQGLAPPSYPRMTSAISRRHCFGSAPTQIEP